MASTLSSDPPSQYCIVRNHARRSWLLPGIKRRIFGKRRNSAILSAPFELDGLEEPRNFFISFMAPDCGAVISRTPMRVRRTTEASAIIPIMASH